MNPHRTRNHGSIEHRESIKRMLDKTKRDNRVKVLRGQLQKMAVDYSMNWKTHGADMDAIRAFKSKQKYQSGANHPSGSKFKFRSDGKSLFLHDYEVARHHKDGIEVSNAGYDSPLTYKTHQALGINSEGSEKHPKGLITLGTKEMDKNSGEWTLINHNDISEEPIIPESMKKNQKARADGTFVKRKKPKRETSEQAVFRERATQKELKEQGLDRGHPLSTVNIQKTDQRIINAITGLNTPLPTDKRGNEAHHLLEYSGDGGVGKKLEKNKDPRKAGNSKMIPKDYHKIISNFQKSSPADNLKRLRQMDSKIRQLKGKLQKIAAKGDIVPTKYYGGNPDTTIKMKPKEYLDKTSSTGLQESIAENRKIEHNSGVISNLNNTHSGNPADNNYVRENTKKKKYYIDQDKDGNYTRDFHKYYSMEDTVGVNELDFIDENTEPTTYEGKTPTGWRGHDTRNKILGTGEDTTGFDRTFKEIFRGDEAGSTEYFKRKLRRGDSIERPFLSVNDKNKVTSHEGRHRSRAMMEEGVTEEEVNVVGDMSKDYYGIKDIISGQQNSLDEVKRQSDLAERIQRTKPFEFNKRMKGRESESVRISPKSLKDKLDKIKEDTRAPIFGRYSKLKGKLQKIATDINRSPVDNNMSKSDEIINSFQNSGLSIEGVDGIYDTKNHKVLDGYNQEDIPRIREIYGEGVFIGTNSETDTRDGPNTNDLERTRKELQAIEDKGGIPALGFDSTEGGSLEALNVAITDSKEKVMDALYDNQWGTYIISPNNSSEIIENPKYTGRNK